MNLTKTIGIKNFKHQQLKQNTNNEYEWITHLVFYLIFPIEWMMSIDFFSFSKWMKRVKIKEWKDLDKKIFD